MVLSARSIWGRCGWLVLILGLIASSVLAPFGCACGGGLAAAGLGTIEAIVAQDAERVAAHFVEEIREDVTFSMEVVFALVDEIRIFNASWLVLSETEDTAEVEVGIDWEATGSGQTRSGRAEERVDLEKVSGEWLISDFGPFEWLLEEVMEFEPENPDTQGVE
jgi:hypothetical protein